MTIKGDPTTKEIKAALKKEFPQVKFSVRKIRRDDSIHVTWTDGFEWGAYPAAVESVVKQFDTSYSIEDSFGDVVAILGTTISMFHTVTPQMLTEFQTMIDAWEEAWQNEKQHAAPYQVSRHVQEQEHLIHKLTWGLPMYSELPPTPNKKKTKSMTTLTPEEKIQFCSDSVEGINNSIQDIDVQIALLEAQKEELEAMRTELIREIAEAREEKEEKALILNVESLDKKSFDFENQEMLPLSDAIAKGYYPIGDWNMMGTIQKIYKSSFNDGWVLKFTDGSRCPMFNEGGHLNTIVAAPPRNNTRGSKSRCCS